jgi:hypothetical protein
MIQESIESNKFVHSYAKQLVDKFEHDLNSEILSNLKDGGLDQYLAIYKKLKDTNVLKISNDEWKHVKFPHGASAFFKKYSDKYSVLKKYMYPIVDSKLKHDDRMFKVDIFSIGIGKSNSAEIEIYSGSNVIKVSLVISYDDFYYMSTHKSFSYELRRRLIQFVSHELQHLYDYVISGRLESEDDSNSDFPKKYKKFLDKNNKLYTTYKYRLLPTEINAFYVGAVVSVLDDIKSNKISISDKDRIISRFTKYFEGGSAFKLNKYPVEIKNRLLSRVYKELITLTKEPDKELDFRHKYDSAKQYLTNIKSLKTKLISSITNTPQNTLATMSKKMISDIITSIISRSDYNWISKKDSDILKTDVVNDLYTKIHSN